MYKAFKIGRDHECFVLSFSLFQRKSSLPQIKRKRENKKENRSEEEHKIEKGKEEMRKNCMPKNSCQEEMLKDRE